MDDLITKTGNYEMRRYNEYDLMEITVGDETKEMVEFIGAGSLNRHLQTTGPAFSAFYNGHLFAIAGINVMWKGVGEAWAIFGTTCLRHGFFIHRTTIRFLNRLSSDLSLERLQAVVLKGHYAGIQWVDRLGFTYEGEMERYFMGNTYLRYVKLYPGGK